jgi:hypothetical protein
MYDFYQGWASWVRHPDVDRDLLLVGDIKRMKQGDKIKVFIFSGYQCKITNKKIPSGNYRPEDIFAKYSFTYERRFGKRKNDGRFYGNLYSADGTLCSANFSWNFYKLECCWEALFNGIFDEHGDKVSDFAPIGCGYTSVVKMCNLETLPSVYVAEN